jgi:hypothetical protein
MSRIPGPLAFPPPPPLQGLLIDLSLGLLQNVTLFICSVTFDCSAAAQSCLLGMTFLFRLLGRALRSVRCGESGLTSNIDFVNPTPKILQLTSPDFSHGDILPKKSGGHGLGDNISPALQWTGVPTGTKELVFVMEVTHLLCIYR